MNKEEYQEYIKEREIWRPIDATVAKLLGKEVACLAGYWDPESGIFSPNMPDEYGGDEDKIIILDKKYYEAIKVNQEVLERKRIRKSGIDLLEPLEYCDLKEVEWTASIHDTGVGEGVEFCTPRKKGAKKWWWEEVPHYSADAEDFKEVENYILEKSDIKPIPTDKGCEMPRAPIDDFVDNIREITKIFSPGRALLTASTKQKVEAAIPVLEKLAN